MLSPGRAALADARIVLLEAPVGYGKTTLAEQLVGARGLAVLRIRAGAQTPLAAALVRALLRTGLGAGADAVGQAEAEAAPDAFLAVLAGLGHAVQLLVDDAHLLGPEGAVVAELVADLPEPCSAVVCGRDLGAFAALARRPDARLVGADELRMDATEVAALLGTSVDDPTVGELLAATEGWPAAVDLAVARLRREPTWSASGAAGVRALLRDLVEQLAREDPRAHLVAALPLVDAATLALVSPGVERPLDLPTRSAGRWRVLPHAVRDLLEPVVPSPEVAWAVARHYHRNGETSSALALLRAADPAGAVRFLAELRWDELDTVDQGVVRDVLETAVADDVGARALLNAARSMELSDRGLRTTWLDRAAAVTDASAVTRRAVTAEVARDVLRSGEVERGSALAREVLAQVTDAEAATSARALVTIGMHAAYLCTPESLAEAARTFEEAAARYRRAGETALLAETLARLGYTALHIAGMPAEGARAMSEALALLPVGDRLRAFWLTMYADVLNVLGRVEESEAAVREAIEIGTRRQDPTTAGMAWWTRSWNAALRGDADGLRAALVQVERHRGAWLQGGQEAEYLGSSAEHLTLVGDVDGYRAYLDRAQVAADEVGYPEVVTTPRAFYEAEHGDPETGLALLDELETIPGVAPGNAARRMLLRAVALVRTGDGDAGRAALAEAEALAASMGVPDLLPRMHHRQLVLVTASLDEPAPVAEPHLQLLGRFLLTVAGEDRTPQPGHPATLVKVLALRGPLTAEAAIDLLWPDADVATGRSRLRNLLSRLKERAGAIVVRRGEVLRLADDVRVDVRAFEQATAAAFEAPSDERIGRARHALALYPGDLLPGDLYEEWAVVDRVRLQRRFVSLADLVAADSVERGDLDEASRLLDLGIASEPLDEARQLELCRILLRQGRTGAAQRAAAQCVAVLADLGVEAGAELVRLAGPA